MKGHFFTMNKLSLEKHRKTRDFIITSTLNILSKKGFAHLSIDDIAKEAGYSKGGILHYFKSKEEIMLEAINTLIRNLMDGLIYKKEPGIGPREEIRMKLIWILQESVNNKVQTKVILDFLAQASNDDKIREIMIDYNNNILKYMYSVIEKGQHAGQFKDDVNPAFISTIIVSNLYALSWRICVDYDQAEDNVAKRFDIEGYVDQLISYFLIE